MSNTVKEKCDDCEGLGEIETAAGNLQPCDTCDGEWCPYCGEPASKCLCEDDE